MFFVNGADEMSVVRLGEGPSFSFGPEEVLFSTANYRTDYYHRSYDVAADGQHFVMIRIWEREFDLDDLIIVENWTQELEDRLTGVGR